MIEVSSSEILSPYAIDIHEYQGPTKLSTTPPPPLQIIETHLFVPTILVKRMSFTHPFPFPVIFLTILWHLGLTDAQNTQQSLWSRWMISRGNFAR